MLNKIPAGKKSRFILLLITERLGGGAFLMGMDLIVF